MNLPEAALFDILAKCLRERGFKVYGELFGIDLVAVRERWLWPLIIEIKTSFTEKLLHQGMYRQSYSPAVFVAAGSKPSAPALRRAGQFGLGVISMRGRRIEVLRLPETGHTWRPDAEQLRKTLEVLEDPGVCARGGLPSLKGEGPAIEVCLAARAYRREHPNATWREVFLAVPNHYCSAASMAGAMRFRGPDGRLARFVRQKADGTLTPLFDGARRP